MIKLIISITLFIGAVLSAVYFVYPKYEEYQQQLAVNVVLEEELENTIAYINELKYINAKIDSNEETFDRVRSAFPKDHDAPSLYYYLRNTITENNLKYDGSLGAFSIAPYRTGNNNHSRLKEVGFSLSLSGSYENMQSFLREIESLIRIINISSFTVTDGGEDNRGGLRVQFDAKTYSY